ncbi:uncharacterized protein [Cherax quadricarinatus]|uniref:uncharacterized protein n=1 Tax=Cherax quadricarinatus TaxID=27406 RepID=UPI00387E6AC5
MLCWSVRVLLLGLLLLTVTALDSEEQKKEKEADDFSATADTATSWNLGSEDIYKTFFTAAATNPSLWEGPTSTGESRLPVTALVCCPSLPLTPIKTPVFLPLLQTLLHHDAVNTNSKAEGLITSSFVYSSTVFLLCPRICIDKATGWRNVYNKDIQMLHMCLNFHPPLVMGYIVTHH